ncbi:MAG: hypothetical protein AAGB97_03530 [Dehalococcoidia bacterium]
MARKPEETYHDISLRVRWDARFAAFLAGLPLDRSTRAYLKKDVILYLRDLAALAQTMLFIVVALAVMALPEPGRVEFVFIYLLYYMPNWIVIQYLDSSLKTEGSSMDYAKMLVEGRKFIAAKVVSTFMMLLLLCLIMFFCGVALSPVLEWDFVRIIMRILILSLAVLQAALLGMVWGERILISGKLTLDLHVARFCLVILLAVGWMGIDFFFIDPQILPEWAKGVFPHVPLIVFGGIIAYCIFRLRKFATAMEDI